MHLGKDTSKIVLACVACRGVDFVIKHMSHEELSTDTERVYLELYCPVCGNSTHTIMIYSGLDIKKLKSSACGES